MLPLKQHKREEEALNHLLAISGQTDKKLKLLPCFHKQEQATSNYDLISAWSDDTLSQNLRKNYIGNCQVNFPKLYQDVEPITNQVNKTKEARKQTIKFSCRNKNTVVKESAFYHFDDIHDYIREYRENITLPSIMKYRKSLLGSNEKTICKECTAACNPYDLIKHCQCFAKQSRFSTVNQSSVCYGSDRDAGRVLKEEKQKKSEKSSVGIKAKQLYECVEKKTTERSKIGEKCLSKTRKEGSNYNNRFCSTMKVHKKEKCEVWIFYGLAFTKARP